MLALAYKTIAMKEKPKAETTNLEEHTCSIFLQLCPIAPPVHYCLPTLYYYRIL